MISHYVLCMPLRPCNLHCVRYNLPRLELHARNFTESRRNLKTKTGATNAFAMFINGMQDGCTMELVAAARQQALFRQKTVTPILSPTPDPVHRPPAPPRTCADCKRCFKTEQSLATHQLRFHTTGGGTFRCKHCPKVFRALPNLLQHSRTHKPAGESCTICRKKFKRKASLIWHRLTHEKASYKCPCCKKTFADFSEYFVHCEPNRRPKCILNEKHWRFWLKQPFNAKS